jgi:hypothetical protein
MKAPSRRVPRASPAAPKKKSPSQKSEQKRADGGSDRARFDVRSLYIVEHLWVAEPGAEFLPLALHMGEDIVPPLTWTTLAMMEWDGRTLYYYDRERQRLGKSQFEVFDELRAAWLFFLIEPEGWPGTVGLGKRLYAVDGGDVAGKFSGDKLLELVAASVRLKTYTWIASPRA